MKSQAGWIARISTALLIILLGAAWVAFAPIQFGGQAAYVIVNGNSMEPLYHRGDLVIIQAQPDYKVGDIVTYRHPQIGPVIHRIIGRDVEHFIFKGDHNDFIDPYQPIRADLIGTSWICLPSVGNVLSQVRTPLNMAILAAVAGVIIMAPSINIGRQPKARKHGQRPTGLASAQHRRNGEGLLMALIVLACASIALATFAFTRPTTHDVSDELTYQQTGSFSYSAPAPAGLYDSDMIQTGEPLFPQLTSDTTFSFNYQLAASAPVDLHGTAQLVVEVGASNGWQRTIEIQPATAFSGNNITASGVLHFAQVRALLNSFEQQTGLEHEQYTLTIAPELVVEGTLAGQALADKFAPRLEFRLDQDQMQLAKPTGTTQDPLKPSKPGLIKYTHVEPNVISLLFLKLEVPLARKIGIGGLVLALLGLLVQGVLMLRAGRPDQAAQIRSKYGALLIDLVDGDPRPDQHIVKLSTIDDLAKLAEKSGQMILHVLSGRIHRYCVHDGDQCYCYQFVGADDNAPDLPQPPQGVTAAPTGAWHAIFLDTLREKGTVAEACRVANVGIAVAYQERIYNPAFAQAWTETRAALREALARKSELR